MNLQKRLSVVIPIGPGDQTYQHLLAQLLDQDLEIICSATVQRPQNIYPKVHWITGEPGRATQLNQGAKVAQGKYLWFLHSDSVLIVKALERVKKIVETDTTDLFYFGLKFSSPTLWWMKLTQLGIFIRNGLCSLPFGDQGFLLAKEVFDFLGTFDESLPYAEDLDFVWKAKKQGVRISKVPAVIHTSARKYEKNGWGKVTYEHLKVTWRLSRERAKKRKVYLRKKAALCIFVKTPEASPVKTRLAKDVGTVTALAFYEWALKKLAVTVASASKFLPLSIYWAVAENTQLKNVRWKSFPTLAQGEGGLGERLYTIYCQALSLYPKVLMIGADCPELSQREIAEALRLLDTSPFVLGPASDGGFYLFGGNRYVLKQDWLKVNYSVDSTCSEMETVLARYGKVGKLPKMDDIDTATDLEALRSRCPECLVPNGHESRI